MARKKDSSHHHRSHDVRGGEGHDHLKGGAGDDNLSGGSGDDVLSGGAGDDVIDGGEGIDTAVLSGSDAATVDLTLTRAQKSGHHGADRFISIENLVGTAFSDRLFGNAENNSLDGGAGNDRLDGRGGDDDLHGGKGNDRLNGGDGTDSLDGGTGNDRVDGGGGDDTVRLDLGNDNLRGGIGSDTLVVGDKAARIDLGVSKAQKTGYGLDKISGFENITGGSGNDHFTGNGALNTLDGGAGNDTLDGGAGADRLTGGDGADTFRFAAAAHSGVTAETMDVVTDFVVGQDKLDLSRIDADTTTEGLQHFTSLSTSKDSAFTKTGDLFFDQDTGILSGDVNGDHVADFSIQLKGTDLTTVSMADFVI